MDTQEKQTTPAEQIRLSDEAWVNDLILNGDVVEKHRKILTDLVGLRREFQTDFTNLRSEPSSAGAQTVVEMHLLRLAEVVANNYQTEQKADNIDFRLHVDKLWETAGKRVSLFREQTLSRIVEAPE